MTDKNNAAAPMKEDRRFQLLVSGISDYAIYMLDPSGVVSNWNAGARRFKGYQANEIIGQHFSRFYTPEDQASGLPGRALETALREGRYEAEGWRVRQDGTRFWANVVVDPIHDDTGTLIGFAKITRDITERRAAEEALRESEQRFRLLVQGVTDYAIYMLSPTGKVTNWNAGAQRIKGFTPEEVIGTDFSRFHTPADQAAGLPARALAIAAEKKRFETEGLRVRKDGSTFWAHVVIDAIYDESGELMGFAKITRDITEKREAAEALERANAALFQSQKMEAIGQLTGGVAHDFNNLLAVITSGVDLLTIKLQGRPEAKPLDGMRRAASRGAALIQQLLAFARQQPLSAENQNLNKLIDAFEPVLQRAGNPLLAFDLDLAPGLWTVSIDAARFETTLLNLVVNARDAMPHGGELTILTQNVHLNENTVGKLPAGRYVRIAVTDSGTGMSPEVASRAFDPFFTTKEIGKGTGLGLSQVYGFIAQSGGEVLLLSEPGKGTTISMYLPAVEGDIETSRPSNAETVLIVEDEPDLLEVSAILCRTIGYEVLTASNGTEAIELLKRTPDIDIVFSDVMMPNGMSGIELARHVHETFPTIKVVLVSGYALPVLQAEHGSLSGLTFISKPYDLSGLAKALRSSSR